MIRYILLLIIVILTVIGFYAGFKMIKSITDSDDEDFGGLV